MKDTPRKNPVVPSPSNADCLRDLEYPRGEDIYSKLHMFQLAREETFVAKVKQDLSALGDDLDVPGTQLDDRNELIGKEDEANNYYSLSADNHTDLYERQDD
jgi:hypothetical protein